MELVIKINKLSFDSYVKLGKIIGVFNGFILGLVFFVSSFFIKKAYFFQILGKFIGENYIQTINAIKHINIFGLGFDYSFNMWHLGLLSIIFLPILVGLIMMILSIISYPLYLLYNKYFKIIIVGDFEE